MKNPRFAEAGVLHFPENLLGLLVPVQIKTNGDCIVWIDRCIALLNVFNHAVFVDDKGRSARPFELQTVLRSFLQYSIPLHHGCVHVAEQRESNADLFGKGIVGSRTVPADSNDD